MQFKEQDENDAKTTSAVVERHFRRGDAEMRQKRWNRGPRVLDKIRPIGYKARRRWRFGQGPSPRTELLNLRAPVA